MGPNSATYWATRPNCGQQGKIAREQERAIGVVVEAQQEVVALGLIGPSPWQRHQRLGELRSGQYPKGPGSKGNMCYLSCNSPLSRSGTSEARVFPWLEPAISYPKIHLAPSEQVTRNRHLFEATPKM